MNIKRDRENFENTDWNEMVKSQHKAKRLEEKPTTNLRTIEFNVVQDCFK